jgi:hypothetical protein
MFEGYLNIMNKVNNEWQHVEKTRVITQYDGTSGWDI